MYRKETSAPEEAEDFTFPDNGQLDPNNRWVVMAQLIPWEDFEEEYAANFPSNWGAPAKSFRVALGTLIIQEKLGTSDRETVEQIRENPYLQYFIGQNQYSPEPPFDASLLVHFRKRMEVDFINKINEAVVRRSQEREARSEKSSQSESEESSEPTHRGQLILDATCAPADISYPTDLNLLNQARVESEKILDALYQPVHNQFPKKPRTYRKLARKAYLTVAKKRRPTAAQKRKAIRQQLQYLKRNLSHIENLIAVGSSLSYLTKREYRMLLVISELYRQQKWMYENRSTRIEERIVSLTQPHLRPIVRGKAGQDVEFGAKLSVSCCGGYVFLDRLSWQNFNESIDLKQQVENYYQRTGYYPESVHAERIYRTRANRALCKERGIRLSGPPLGRPPKNVSAQQKKQAAEDESIRNTIEGKFGQAKRRFSLDRIMAKLEGTSKTSIAITFLVMNLVTALRPIFSAFFCQEDENLLFSDSSIKGDYRKTVELLENLLTRAV